MYMWIGSSPHLIDRRRLVSPLGYQSPALGDSVPAPGLQDTHRVTSQLGLTASTLSRVPRLFTSAVSQARARREVESGPRISQRGISPGLVISSLPVSVHVCGQSSSFVRVRLRSCAFVFVHGRPHSFVGGGLRSWVVGFAFAFVRGRSGSFLSVRICSWAVVTLTRCGGGGCSSWQLRGGGVGWLVVVNEDDERRRMSLFVVWLPRRTWWVSKRRLGGSLCLLTWAGHDLVTVLACRQPGVHAGG